MSGDFTEITVSNCDNDLHLVLVTSAKLDIQMPDNSEVEIGGQCYFGCSLFSSLNCTSVLLCIPAQYKWHQPEILPHPETSQVEVEFPCAPDLPDGYHPVLIGCWINRFVPWRTLNGCLVVSFLLLYGFMQPRGSAPKEGDDVMARLHVTCPGPSNTHGI